MRLREVIDILRSRGLDVSGSWEFRGRRGIYLGDPKKHFPFPAGPEYSIDTTDDDDPELTPEELHAIARRFNIEF
jgi:hypothetical protein